MYQVFPELHLDLLCYGPIERGRDASHGGVEFYNLCVDGAGLATVADSFAAVEQRIDCEKRLTWDGLMDHLDANWAGADGRTGQADDEEHPALRQRRARELMNTECKIARTFTQLRQRKADAARVQPDSGALFLGGHDLLMGKDVGATPNGRHTGDPISHGPNPDPGFRKDAAPTALALAVASVQPGYGNTAPCRSSSIRASRKMKKIGRRSSH